MKHVCDNCVTRHPLLCPTCHLFAYLAWLLPALVTFLSSCFLSSSSLLHAPIAFVDVLAVVCSALPLSPHTQQISRFERLTQ